VKAAHLEPGVPVSDGLVAAVAGALRDCAAWHGTPEVQVSRSDPPEFAQVLGLGLDDAPVASGPTPEKPA
jgi:hypothetical protein